MIPVIARFCKNRGNLSLFAVLDEICGLAHLRQRGATVLVLYIEGVCVYRFPVLLPHDPHPSADSGPALPIS